MKQEIEVLAKLSEFLLFFFIILFVFFVTKLLCPFYPPFKKTKYIYVLDYKCRFLMFLTTLSRYN